MRLILGISGATGAIYGIRLLEVLKEKGIETHLIITSTSEKIIRDETSYSVEEVKHLAAFVYNNEDLSAPISSGSFRTDGMVVIPCSIKSLSGIAQSHNENLLIRAADVTLKEKRRLALGVRETLLQKGHLDLMLQVCQIGAILLPPMPAFHFHPETIDDLVNLSVKKVLDFFDIEHDLFKRWGSSAIGRYTKAQRRKIS